MTKNDAICVAFTYNFANLSIEGKDAAKSMLGDNFEDIDWVNGAYAELVESLAADILPSGWATTFVSWGGKCFSRNGRDPKQGTLMAGESRKYRACSSELEIKEELQNHVMIDDNPASNWS